MHHKRIAREQRQYSMEPQAILEISRQHAVIDRVILKGRHIVIPDTLQKNMLEQLCINHLGVDKTKLLVCESIYGPGSNRDDEKYIKIVLHILNFSKCNQGMDNTP